MIAPVAHGGSSHPYNDKEFCYRDLIEARRLFGLRTTTQAQLDAVALALANIILYGPDEVRDLAIATSNELNLRRMMCGERYTK